MFRSSYQGEETRRIPHSVHVDQVFVPPILAKRHSVGKSMILAHSIAAARVLCAPNRFGERNIHHVGIQLTGAETKLLVPGGSAKTTVLFTSEESEVILMNLNDQRYPAIVRSPMSLILR